MIDALVDAVCARITAELSARVAAGELALGDVHVGVFPDTLAEVKVMRHAAIYVAHDGSSFAAAESMLPISQARTIDVAVTFYVRALRGPRGAYGLLDMTRAALLGWAPPSAGRMTLSAERFVNHAHAIWQWTAIYQTPSHVVARIPAEPDAPRLVSASVVGDATLVVPGTEGS